LAETRPVGRESSEIGEKTEPSANETTVLDATHAASFGMRSSSDMGSLGRTTDDHHTPVSK
jgi:hypothetical protein